MTSLDLDSSLLDSHIGCRKKDNDFSNATNGVTEYFDGGYLYFSWRPVSLPLPLSIQTDGPLATIWKTE